MRAAKLANIRGRTPYCSAVHNQLPGELIKRLLKTRFRVALNDRGRVVQAKTPMWLRDHLDRAALDDRQWLDAS